MVPATIRLPEGPVNRNFGRDRKRSHECEHGTLRACATGPVPAFMTALTAYRTVKLSRVVMVPAGVVIVIGPVVAPAGTVAQR